MYYVSIGHSQTKVGVGAASVEEAVQVARDPQYWYGESQPEGQIVKVWKKEGGEPFRFLKAARLRAKQSQSQ